MSKYENELALNVRSKLNLNTNLLRTSAKKTFSTSFKFHILALWYFATIVCCVYPESYTTLLVYNSLFEQTASSSAFCSLSTQKSH